MTHIGHAFLALWNDVDPTRDEEYETWHATEHVPERVSIPGILAARRYAAPGVTRHKYFTLYALDGLPVLESDPYRAVVNQPTRWSSAMRPMLRNFHRQPCSTTLSIGRGIGGCAGAIRFRLPHGVDLSPHLMEQPRIDPRVSALHLGRVDAMANFPIPNVEPVITDGSDGHVLIIEAGSLLATGSALDRLIRLLALEGAATAIEAQAYTLICALQESEVDPLLWRLGRHVA